MNYGGARSGLDGLTLFVERFNRDPAMSDTKPSERPAREREDEAEDHGLQGGEGQYRAEFTPYVVAIVTLTTSKRKATHRAVSPLRSQCRS
jgi:hypothetical protein